MGGELRERTCEKCGKWFGYPKSLKCINCGHELPGHEGLGFPPLWVFVGLALLAVAAFVLVVNLPMTGS